MANEGTVTISLGATGGISTGTLTKRFDWVVSQGQSVFTQTVGTTEEPMSSFVYTATNGYIAIKNEDATNYVQIGFSAGVYGIRLKAGMLAVMFLEPGAAPVWKANTAACRVSVWHLGGA